MLEFPQNSIPNGTENLIQWLRSRGTLPIIVHPERNLALQKSPEKLDPLIAMGCQLQLTAGSLTGKFGIRAKRLAVRLVKEEKVDYLATDCHNLRYRPPNLSQGVKAASKLIGKDKAAELVTDNVFHLLVGSQQKAAI